MQLWLLMKPPLDYSSSGTTPWIFLNLLQQCCPHLFLLVEGRINTIKEKLSKKD